MSKKQFIIVKSIYDYYALVDKERKDTKQILLLSLHKEQLNNVADLLNEQQSIIRRDKKSIETMMSNMEKLEEENERLNNDFHFLKEIHQEGSKSCEKWKQYKETQIQQLEEENKQLRKDKEILKERLRECRMKMDKFNCR